MSYRLFLDDERQPPEKGHWVIARTFHEAITVIQSLGFPEFISFDHDLGDGPSGYDFVKWLGEYVMDNDVDLSGFDYYVHSQNPVGKQNIISYIDNLRRARDAG